MAFEGVACGQAPPGPGCKGTDRHMKSLLIVCTIYSHQTG